MNAMWETVAQKRLRRRGLVRTKSLLVITIHDSKAYDGYFPSVYVELYDGNSTHGRNKLFSVNHQPVNANAENDGLSLYDTFKVVKDALKKFVEEANEEIHKKQMEASDQATINGQLEMAAHTDTIDEAFALADHLREIQ